MNDEKYRDTLQACFYGDKGAYNQCMYEFQHRALINKQLQSNWNSLRDFFEKGKKEPNYIKGDMFWNEFCEISLNEMNELEGVKND